jgi:hypothetical protein
MSEFKEDKEYFDDFAWAIPIAFTDAIRTCCFQRGDTLYDTKKAYEGPWGEAKTHISYSIQVKSPLRTTLHKIQKEKNAAAKDKVFGSNWKQSVIFNLTDYKKNKTKEITTSQGHLYTLLWKGNHNCLDEQIIVQQPQLTISNKEVKKAVPYFKRILANDACEIIFFLMPYDRSNSLQKKKFDNIKSGFTNHTIKIEITTPKNAGFVSDKEFVPTLKIACFYFYRITSFQIEDILKKSLHTKNINSHGHLERPYRNTKEMLF